MLHHIDVSTQGIRGQSMAETVQTCVHCGFCLPTCPTYQILGDESDSPRGRIILMKQVLEGKLQESDVAPHIDRCLGCLACETNCPSGVAYSHLLSPYRDRSRAKGKTKFSLRRWLALITLPYPSRFRWAVRFGTWTKGLAFLAPKSLRPMLEMIPDRIPPAQPILQETYAPQGTPRGKVALLAGCAQQVLDPDILFAAIRVLNRNGIEVHVPRQQGCCGALAWHVGHGDIAQSQARVNLDAMRGDYDAILSTAAGCGSAMQEYPLLMQGTPQHSQARDFAAKSLDILTYLFRMGIESPPALQRPLRVAYHDACHLAHAQREILAPRRLLQCIPRLQLVPLADSDLCCGSAGTYNMDQPEMANELGRRKAATILQSNCDVVALANIGCEVQIAKHLQLARGNRPVLHVIQILDAAYRQIEIA